MQWEGRTHTPPLDNMYHLPDTVCDDPGSRLHVQDTTCGILGTQLNTGACRPTQNIMSNAKDTQHHTRDTIYLAQGIKHHVQDIICPAKDTQEHALDTPAPSVARPLKRLTILLLAPLKKMSGNYSTAVRLRQHFVTAGFHCLLEETKTFANSQTFQEYISEEGVCFVISLHAYHSGLLLVGCPIPYVVILGGTDVHEYSRDPDKYELMKTVLHKASKIVAFARSLVTQVFKKWPEITWSDISIIPQAVSTRPSTFSLQTYLRDRGHIPRGSPRSSPADPQIFLVVGGIRAVKDPLFLVSTFSEWHANSNRSAYLVFLGPLLQEDYGKKFIQEVERSPGVVYVAGVQLEDTHAALRGSTALVNSSRSEGMASAILEAMDVGTPVIARDIPANCDLIEHGETGLLFHTPQDFVKMAETLLTSPDVRARLTKKAKEQISRRHSLATEQDAYLCLVKACTEKNIQTEIH